MTIRQPIALSGAPGSPYTRKMLAVLRYRHIPYRFLVGGVAAAPENFPRPKVALLPTFYFETPEGSLEAMVDSTPIIRRLEGDALGRSVLPEDPAIAFLNYLLEDYADEWLTKAMFHYRWHYAADIELAGNVLPRWRDLTATAAEIAPQSQFVRERQIGRLYVVGSNDVTAPVIEASYQRFLKCLDACIEDGPLLVRAPPPRRRISACSANSPSSPRSIPPRHDSPRRKHRACSLGCRPWKTCLASNPRPNTGWNGMPCRPRSPPC